MAYRNKADASESLEDLLKALEPDSGPSEANLSTSELEDLIKNLDEVVETKPTPVARFPTPAPPKSSSSDGLEDLLRELESTDTPKTSTASSSKLAAASYKPPAKRDEDFDSVNSLLDDTLRSLSINEPSKPAYKETSYTSYTSSSSTPHNVPSGGSMDAILANMSAAFDGGDDPISKDIVALSSFNERDQERALRNIINFCLEDHNRTLVRQRDGISPIVKLLSSSASVLQLLACHAVANLALQPENRAAVRATRSAFPDLVRALGSHDDKIQEKALSAVANLCVDDANNRAEFRAAGLTPRLVSLLSSSNEDVVKRALTTVVNTSFDVDSQREFIKSGGIHAIVPFLSSANIEKQTNAAWALAALTMGGVEVQNALYDAGAVPKFINLLSCGNEQAELKALTALVNLSGNDNLQRRIIDAGAIPAVLSHVSSSNINSSRMALQTLQNLAIDDSGKGAIHSYGGVEKVLGVLRQGSADLMPHALRVTINLTGDSRVRRTFVDSGALQLVERLTTHHDPNVSSTARQALNNLRLPS